MLWSRPYENSSTWTQQKITTSQAKTATHRSGSMVRPRETTSAECATGGIDGGGMLSAFGIRKATLSARRRGGQNSRSPRPRIAQPTAPIRPNSVKNVQVVPAGLTPAPFPRNSLFPARPRRVRAPSSAG
jgi:hypothetical protein